MVIRILSGTDWDGYRFNQNDIQFKTYELFISGIFHLIFSDHSWPQVTETIEKGNDGLSQNPAGNPGSWGIRWLCKILTLTWGMGLVCRGSMTLLTSLLGAFSFDIKAVLITEHNRFYCKSIFWVWISNQLLEKLCSTTPHLQVCLWLLFHHQVMSNPWWPLGV